MYSCIKRIQWKYWIGRAILDKKNRKLPTFALAQNTTKIEFFVHKWLKRLLTQNIFPGAFFVCNTLLSEVDDSIYTHFVKKKIYLKISSIQVYSTHEMSKGSLRPLNDVQIE